jgi:hypothetical protein
MKDKLERQARTWIIPAKKRNEKARKMGGKRSPMLGILKNIIKILDEEFLNLFQPFNLSNPNDWEDVSEQSSCVF